MGAALRGVDGVPVEVEVKIGSQLPRVDVVGLAETAVREAAARVRAAIDGLGVDFPQRRVTVNLAPAALPKSGAALDLPIALGVLAAAGAIEARGLERLGLVGELALDGRLRPVRGALALTLGCRSAGCRRVIVPAGNAAEAALTPEVEVLSAGHLREVVAHVGNGAPLAVAEAPWPPAACEDLRGPDLSDVRGQERAKRALEIAAAGGHALLLRGVPGAGKTLLARRLPGVLPPLEFAEAVEVTRIHGAAGQLREDQPVVTRRPFRAPHHTASTAGLLGGGHPPSPGEASLAHRGVLFLDELPEFERRSLEALRQVVEERRVVVARARASCVFPADFLLVAAANPCPCGWRGSRRDCRCDDAAVARYAARISGPLLDRIDLHVAIEAVPWRELDACQAGEPSRTVAARIAGARRIQQQRGAAQGYATNATIPDGALDAAVAATADARRLLGRAVEGLALSARAARRVLKVARTIADLAGDARPGPAAVAEALSYRDAAIGT